MSAALAPLAGALAPGTAQATGGVPGEVEIRSSELLVRVDLAFPRIISYTAVSTGAVIHGRADPLNSLLVNGQPYTPQVTGTAQRDRVGYLMLLPGGTRISAEIAVDGSTTTFRVTGVADTDALRVHTLEIPDHDLVTIRSDQPGGTVVAAKLQLNKATEGDTVVAVTAATPADPAPLGCAYVVAATDQLGVALESNTVYDHVSSAAHTTWENGRFWRQARIREGWREVGIRCGQWTCRADGAAVEDTEPLPYATVILTGDRNGDGRTDWQDAAIAMRDIMVQPLGADDQHLRVVPHIPFNFASQATNPFLTVLDNVKRISLATDGLRQFTLLKGYQSEGHDSAHPDYGGNYNRRAGGLEDLNTLLRGGKRWNSDFAVHVNTTEAYPVAEHFSEALVDLNNPQWDWLDQSYRIDARHDLLSGDIAARFRQLREETAPELDMLYIDVFRESGWTSDRLQRELRAQGWTVTSEWGHGLERSSLWSHWANETDYGPDTSRGINSTLIRFIRHHQKDVFADRFPLLGTAKLGTFEGWQGKTDWNAFYANIWRENLPAKYLQAYPIKTWSAHEITFFGPTATSVSDTDGTRRITTDGRTVYAGGAYLLPWEPRRALDPDRLYHYNPTDGETSWELPRGWSGARKVALYRLTDTGRVLVTDLPVREGRVTVDAEAGQPYVLYRDRAPEQADPRWGEGTALVDPGFNSGGLDGRQARGPVSVVRNSLGDHELVIAAGDEASIAQRLQRLAPGSYAASVQVEVGATAAENRRAWLEIRTADGVTAANWTDTSTAVNYVAADSKHDSRMQRMFTWFTVPPAGGPVDLVLRADPGQARVVFDNVRVVKAVRPTLPGALVFEDFEDVPQGWGPFVKGDAGGATDPRTHIAQRHGRFTQRGWNGKAIDDVIDGGRSLKSRGENGGLVYRTVPCTVRFVPGHRYRVSLRYENEAASQYAWVTATDRPDTRELSRVALSAATAPTTYSYEFTAPADGEAWVGLAKVGDDGAAEFSLDAFTVVDLGTAG